MKNKADIEREIEKTISLLDGKNKMKADAFFYTRLSAKMEQTESNFSFEWLLTSPWLKPLIVAFVLFINIISISHLIKSDDRELTNDDVVSLFNEEYFMTQSTDSYLVINEDL
ncbi:MAG: hypothetical protein JEZ09_20930 [Salinivirgaceae bacterium]|nr:hypothetical protein [Salinivirgaceae bacterium]